MYFSKKSLIIISSTLISMLSACEQTNKSSTIKYFNIASLVKEQIGKLQKENPTIQKQVLVDNKKETINTKNINWSHELELFLQADINKSAYLQSYDSVQTESSTIYRLKSSERSPVKSLIISHNTPNQAKIEAIMQTANYLYNSEKKISMNLENGHLKSYQIEGYQQLFIGDRKNFFVSGIVVNK